MNTLDRRHLLRTAAGTGAGLLAGRWAKAARSAADKPEPRIKIGQIGTAHEHASAKKGYQETGFPPMTARYDDQRIERAQIIRGERVNPYPLQHELLVQECLLEACGDPLR